DASHELKTPLTTIRGEAEVALMSERSIEEQRLALRTILGEAERMSQIMEALLLVARADSERIQLRREPVPLDELLLSAYEQFEQAARAKSVAVELVNLEEVEIEGDRVWLLQLVANLLNNAIKY